MQKQFLAIIVALFGSVGMGFALPTCQGSPISNGRSLMVPWNNCFAEYTWKDGTRYVGEWRDNQPGGKGRKIWTDGTQYVGEWRNGWMRGEGRITHRNGDTYVGGWKRDSKSGYGTYIYTNGTKCVGEYKKDLLNGQAKCSFSNGVVQDGIWKNNKFIGTKPSADNYLKDSFMELPKDFRKQIQINLRELGFYKSSIDGKFGKGTSSALIAYNKKYLRNSNLKKSNYIEKLFNKILTK